jgi:RNA polymerase sigma factor, sigma-70 family
MKTIIAKDSQYTFSGDKDDFEKLYRDYAPYAFKVALLVTKNHSLAADIVQETFIRVYLNLPKYNREKPFKPWFYKILINECNRSKSKIEGVLYIEDYQETVMNQTANMESAMESQEIINALANLDKKIRTPLVLKYIHGFTAQEISEIMAVNMNTIKSRLNFGKKKLRKLLTGFHGEVI